MVLSCVKQRVDIDLLTIPDSFKEAVTAQSIIGWENFLLGCWSIEWVRRLREEYAEKEINRLPERTLAAIIARLWEISWDLWLGRNAAVCPSSVITAEGETIPSEIRPSRLSRRQRRRHKEGVERSQSIMAAWLASARHSA